MVFSISLWRDAMEIKQDWDAIVIGGGLAGSAAAIQLAQAGQQVLLLEKERKAHHKVCGEFISYEAQFYLKQLGIDLLALGAVPISKMRLIRQNQIVETALPFEALSLSRYVLDEALLQMTNQHGAQVIRGAIATNLMQKQPNWQVGFQTTQPSIVTGKALFLSTGKHDIRGHARPSGLHNDLIGFKMHFQGTELSPHRDTTDVILFDGGYAGVEQVENNITNLCLVVSKTAYANIGKSWTNLLGKLLNETPALAARLKNTLPCWPKPLAIFGIPYGLVQTANAPQLFLLGDQMAVIPSFCGNGMSIALHTAHSAVQNYLNNTAPDYYRTMRKQLKARVSLASCLSQTMVNPFGQKFAFKLCQTFPGCLPWIATATRLPGAN